MSCMHYDCTYRDMNGSCKVTACANPKYDNSGTYVMEAGGTFRKVADNSVEFTEFGPGTLPGSYKNPDEN